MWEKDKNFDVGDLVYHLLYGREWVGIILEVNPIEKGLSSGRKMALIHMIPGSEYDDHFENAFSEKEMKGRGWVATNWLIKLKAKK